nr:MAG: hypothetical protein [Tuatara cloaca-associated picorna-like virus-1]
MDTETSQTIEQTNTAFVVEQDTAEQLIPTQSIERTLPAVRENISEDAWTIKKMLKKPIRAVTGTWSTSSTSGTCIKPFASQASNGIGVPYEMLNKVTENMQTNLLKSYTFLRTTMILTFQLNSTRFNCGRLMLVTEPWTSGPLASTDIRRMSMYPHVFVDAANSADVEIEIPWFSPVTAFNQTLATADIQNLGQFYIVVVDPLKTPTGAATEVAFTIWIRFENTELHVPINPAYTPVITPVAPTFSLVRNARMQAQIQPDYNPGQGLFDSIGSLWNNTIDAVKNGFNAVDKAINGDFSGAIEDVGKAIDHGVSAFEEGSELALLLDRPRDPQCDLAVQRQTGAFAYGLGKDTSTRFSLSPFDHYRPSGAHFHSFLSTNTISDILSRYTILQTVSWTTSQTVGRSLYDVPVHPLYMIGSTGAPDYPNWPAFLANMFNYWRGSICMRLSIIATHFHAGRLMIIHTPGYVGSITLNEAANWPNAILDLANTENRSHEFILHFNQTMPYLRCFNDTPQGSSFAEWFGSASTVNGRFHILVLNELRSTENVASEISILCEYKCGDDFHFWSPRNPGFSPVNTHEVININSGVAASEIKGLLTRTDAVPTDFNPAQAADDQDESTTNTLQLGSAVCPSPVGHSGLSITNDIRDLIRRYSEAHTLNFLPCVIGNPGNTIYLPVNPTAYLKADKCILAYLANMFRAWSGSLRYKLLIYNSNIDPAAFSVRHIPSRFIELSRAPNALASNEWTLPDFYAGINANVTGQHALEFEIPYRSQYHCLATRSDYVSNPELAYNGTLAISLTDQFKLVGPDRAVSFACTLFIAAGDDFNFHYPVPPPSTEGTNVTPRLVNFVTFPTTAATMQTQSDPITTRASQTQMIMTSSGGSSTRSASQAPIPRARDVYY